jgi:putative ATP-dependent endonuclease of OLD family
MHAGLADQQKADLERYLDATRAELLFARLAILVEGDAERYILPALASAMNFDLDEYGISVISVQGTDFAPFHALLGKEGLDIPNIVVTDGDRVVSPAPATSDGLLRGLRLLSSDTAQEMIGQFPEHPRRDGHKCISAELDESIRKELDKNNVFVGDITLEIDLARMMSDLFSKALGDFLGAQAAEGQNQRLDQISDSSDTQEIRSDFLSRIETIGKGRFAQRLAGYIQNQKTGDIARHISGPHPMNYIFQALDRASHLMRARGLDDGTEDSDSSE